MKIWVILLLVIMGLTQANAFPDYYALADHEKAQAEARKRALPLVWLLTYPDDLTRSVPPSMTRAYFSQMALASLENRAVIIVADAGSLNQLPTLIGNEVHTTEGGLKSTRVAFPKLIFTNPEATKSLGRVSCRQLIRERDVEINAELLAISNDPTSLVPPTPAEMAAAAAAPTDAGSSDAVPASSSETNSPDGATSPWDSWMYAGIGLCVAVIGFVIMRARSREDPYANPPTDPPTE